jgi:His-Xaa-Ser system protein HxsD
MDTEKIKINENKASFIINTKIYSIDVIKLAAYIMIDKAFILLDGDPENEITVEILKKNENTDLKKTVIEFNQELLNYSAYKIQSERNKTIRELIIHRALYSNIEYTDEETKLKNGKDKTQ